MNLLCADYHERPILESNEAYATPPIPDSTRRHSIMKTTSLKAVLRHSVKSLLCILQLLAVDFVANKALADLLQQMVETKTPGHTLLILAVDVATFFALWWYYDHIDDAGFRRFCRAESTPNLLRDPSFLTGHGLTVLGATPILAKALRAPLSFSGLRELEVTAIALGVSFLFVSSASLLRIKRLHDTWAIQKNLVRPGNKKHRLLSRILQAIVFGCSLILAVLVGIRVFLPMILSFARVFTTILDRTFLYVTVGIVAVCLFIQGSRRMFSRRKFLCRLKRLRQQGELDYEVIGHPYLSMFIRRVSFGLTVTDLKHPDDRGEVTPVTYRVGVADCGHRRGILVLCEHQLYQFVYSFQIRRIYRGGTKFSMSTQAMRTIDLPGMSFRTTHRFDFPAGEGERILLIDPTPYRLGVQGRRRGELTELDNGSRVFGYTVYGKNSFLNLLERI